MSFFFTSGSNIILSYKGISKFNNMVKCMCLRAFGKYEDSKNYIMLKYFSVNKYAMFKWLNTYRKEKWRLALQKRTHLKQTSYSITEDFT